MRTKLWGGPHDGTVVTLDGEPQAWRMAVPLSLTDATSPEAAGRLRIAEYRHNGSTGRYEYAGQEWQ